MHFCNAALHCVTQYDVDSQDGNNDYNDGYDDDYDDNDDYDDGSSSFDAPLFIRGGGPSLSDESIDLLDTRDVDDVEPVPIITQDITPPSPTTQQIERATLILKCESNKYLIKVTQQNNKNNNTPDNQLEKTIVGLCHCL